MPEPILISITDAAKLTRLSRSSINAARAAGKFPAAVRLGEKRVAFVKAEVEAWIAERVAARDTDKK